MTALRIDLMPLDDHDRHRLTPDRRFRLDELAAAFERIRDHRDWKAPIHAVIHVADRDLVAAAVTWFTGTTAEFREQPTDPHRLVVDAPGQRLGPRGTAEELPRRFGAQVQLVSRGTGTREANAVPDCTD